MNREMQEKNHDDTNTTVLGAVKLEIGPEVSVEICDEEMSFDPRNFAQQPQRRI